MWTRGKRNDIDTATSSIDYVWVDAELREGSTFVQINPKVRGTYDVTIRVVGTITNEWKANDAGFNIWIISWDTDTHNDVSKVRKAPYLSGDNPNSEIEFDRTFRTRAVITDDSPRKIVMVVEPWAYVGKGDVKLEWSVKIVKLTKVK
jgi:hypothetical protein